MCLFHHHAEKLLVCCVFSWEGGPGCLEIVGLCGLFGLFRAKSSVRSAVSWSSSLHARSSGVIEKSEASSHSCAKHSGPIEVQRTLQRQRDEKTNFSKIILLPKPNIFCYIQQTFHGGEAEMMSYPPPPPRPQQQQFLLASAEALLLLPPCRRCFTCLPLPPLCPLPPSPSQFFYVCS